jgi:phage-related protein
LGRVIDWFENLSPRMQGVVSTIAALVIAIGPLLAAFGSFLIVLPMIVAGAKVLGAMLLGLVGIPALIVVGIVALAAGLVMLWKRSETFRNVVTGAFQALRKNAATILGEFRKTLAQWGSWAMSFWRSHGASIVGFVRGAFQQIRSVVGPLLNAVRGIIVGVMRALSGDWRGAWNSLRDAARSALMALRGVITGLVPFLGSAALSLGRAIITGIVNGIKAGAGAIAGAARDAAKSALDSAKNLLKIRSPSRVMAEQVGGPISEGIAMGIDREAAGVEKSIRHLVDGSLMPMRGAVGAGRDVVGGTGRRGDVSVTVNARTDASPFEIARAARRAVLTAGGV